MGAPIEVSWETINDAILLKDPMAKERFAEIIATEGGLRVHDIPATEDKEFTNVNDWNEFWERIEVATLVNKDKR